MEKQVNKMWVKYVGRVDMVTADYDGIRYVFSKANPIVEIPAEVYTFMSKDRTVDISDTIIPCSAPITKEPKETPSITDEEKPEEPKKEIKKKQRKKALKNER